MRLAGMLGRGERRTVHGDPGAALDQPMHSVTYRHAHTGLVEVAHFSTEGARSDFINRRGPGAMVDEVLSYDARGDGPDLDAADEQMRRDLLDEANAEFGGEAELGAGFARAGEDLTVDQIRAPLREELLRRAAAAYPHPSRLTNQEVAQALAPQGDPAWIQELLPSGGWSGR